MAPLNKFSPQNFQLIEKHFKKMVRKIFVLTFDRAPQNNQHMGFGIYGSKAKADSRTEQAPSLPLTENLPSHLHVAAIMSERTAEEKQSFGQMSIDAGLTEDKLDWVI